MCVEFIKNMGIEVRGGAHFLRIWEIYTKLSFYMKKRKQQKSYRAASHTKIDRKNQEDI